MIYIILFIILECTALWGARRAYETSPVSTREGEAGTVLAYGTVAAAVLALVIGALWQLVLTVLIAGAIIWGAYTLIMKWVRKTAKVHDAAS